MGIEIPLLNSCCCFSIRTGAIIVGSLELFIYILYFVDTLIYRLSLTIEDQYERYLVLMNDIIYEYVEIIQTAFSVVLIYGALKEKSSFITAWLLAELAKMIDGIWNTVLVIQYWFHWGYVIDQCILTGIGMINMWIVYSFYNTMPKSKYIL
ncbi:uncharacterized protein [Halyomorpha halys]|uniref:uncharacterized protein n=1 Tax=Halyomorpha halys TaxID=286706 RepID=UPI0006D4E785|nr:uncharacterized protein LOC106681994 [Halyomorpha halys]